MSNLPFDLTPARALAQARLMRANALAALATLALSVALLATLPATAKLSAGFRTPVLALEFARTPADLAFVSGPDAAPVRQQMYLAHQIDLLFPFAYAGLLALLLSAQARRGLPAGRVGLVCALAIIPGDLAENTVIFQILAELEQRDSVVPLLSALHLATWCKWAAIGLTALVLALTSWQEKAWVASGLSLAAGVALLATWLTDARGGVVELMGLLVTLWLGFLALRAVRDGWRGWRGWRREPK